MTLSHTVCSQYYTRVRKCESEEWVPRPMLSLIVHVVRPETVVGKKGHSDIKQTVQVQILLQFHAIKMRSSDWSVYNV